MTANGSLRALLAGLARSPGARALDRALRAHHEIPLPALLDGAAEEVGRLVHIDLPLAVRLSRTAATLARIIGDDRSRGLSLRAEAHVLYTRARYDRALKLYGSAARIFRSVGDKPQLARTLSSSLQALIYLGRYAEAFRGANEARRLFQRAGDARRLARLNSNVGNIHIRQGRFREAIRLYRRARARFESLGEPLDVAVALRNLAVCHIGLGEFQDALESYQQARDHCQRHGLSRAAVEVDYNVAYLYYLRGQYTRAFTLYRATRQRCTALRDRYHEALCDLDQAEMSLELNLSQEAADLAGLAHSSFGALGMTYESAKALAFQGIGLAQMGQPDRGLPLLGRARSLFLRERNRTWPALIDLHEALVLFQYGRRREARHRAMVAWRSFSGSALASKAALCNLLLARMDLATGARRRARDRCLAAIRAIERTEAPVLHYQAHLVLGQVEEALGNTRAAYQAFERAHACLVNLRSHIQADAPKIAFLKDKSAVYESLLRLSMTAASGRPDFQAAFSYIEQAKSRSLADLIAFRAQELPAPAMTRSTWVTRLRGLREQLNGCYREIEQQETSQRGHPVRAAQALRRRAAALEAELLRALGGRRTGDEEFRSLQTGGTISLDEIRGTLPDGTLILEYYQAGETLYVGVLGRKRLDIVGLGSASRLLAPFRLLQFQLAKFRLGPDHVRRFAASLLEAARAHLQDLYRELVGPIRDKLDAGHLIVVPHGFLHYVPFHALLDGSRFVIDDFAISYAPSASVYSLCALRPTARHECSLVLGVPDASAPYIHEEVQAVAAALPKAQLLLGSEATEERLRTLGRQSRVLHIATHGVFRQDNPMFSSIRLGDSHLSLFDLYDLCLDADLVTLSGCGTGLSVVVGGDELLGLVRGLLYAGARAALLTLWDVNDRSTAEFMRLFYRALQVEPDRARAAQGAMRELREMYPHPYHWAPFVLVGQTAPV